MKNEDIYSWDGILLNSFTINLKGTEIKDYLIIPESSHNPAE